MKKEAGSGPAAFNHLPIGKKRKGREVSPPVRLSISTVLVFGKTKGSNCGLRAGVTATGSSYTKKKEREKGRVPPVSISLLRARYKKKKTKKKNQEGQQNPTEKTRGGLAGAAALHFCDGERKQVGKGAKTQWQRPILKYRARRGKQREKRTTMYRTLFYPDRLTGLKREDPHLLLITLERKKESTPRFSTYTEKGEMVGLKKILFHFRIRKHTKGDGADGKGERQARVSFTQR